MRVVAALLCLGLLVAAVSADSIPILNGEGDKDAGEDDRFEETEPSQVNATTPAPTLAPYTPANSGYRVPCDLTAERGICLFNGEKVLVPDAAPQGLVASYNFNDGHCLDYGHNKLHGATVVPAAPGRGGQGNAARLEGDSYIEVPDAAPLHALDKEFTISFWLFLDTPAATGTAPADTKCPISYLGEPAGKSVFQINYNPKTQGLSASILGNKFVVNSNCKLKLQRWYHIGFTRSSSAITLFINGIRDVRLDATGTDTFSRYQFFMGRLPVSSAGCENIPMFIDDLAIYDHAVKKSFIEAQAFPSLGGIKPGFIHLACKNCTFEEAAAQCTGGYHLCYENELLAGGYTAAMSVGYLQWNSLTHINDVYDQTQQHKGGHKFASGICCREG